MHCQECGLRLWTAIEKDICLCCSKKKSEAIQYCNCPDVAEVDNSLEAAEKRHILKVYDKHKGSKSATARELKVPLRTLYNKLISYGLHIKEY